MGTNQILSATVARDARPADGIEVGTAPRRRRRWREVLPKVAAALLVATAVILGAVVLPFELIFLLFLGVVAAGFAVRARWDVVSAVTVYVALLLALPARYIFGPIGEGATPAAIVGLGAMVLWALGRVFPRLGLASGVQPVRVAILLVVASVFISYAAANAQPITSEEAQTTDRGVFLILAMGGPGLLVADGVISRARFETLMRRLVMGGVALAVLGAVQYFSGIDPAPWLRLPGLTEPATSFIAERSVLRRVAGTTLHPIEYGILLAMLLPIASHFAFRDWDAQRRVRGFVATGLIGVAVLLSVSRSAVLAAAVAAVVVIPTWPRRRRLAAIMASPFLALGTAAAMPGLLGTIRALFTYWGTDPSISGRTDDYELIPYVVEGQIWFGQGFRSFVPSRFFILDNQWLMSLIETGVVGLVALLLLFAIPVWCGFKVWRTSPRAEDRSLGVALAASLIAGALAFGTFDALSFPTVAGATFIIIGAVGVLWRLNEVELGRMPTRAVHRGGDPTDAHPSSSLADR